MQHICGSKIANDIVGSKFGKGSTLAMQHSTTVIVCRLSVVICRLSSIVCRLSVMRVYCDNTAEARIMQCSIKCSTMS